ncbi:flagellar operon protein [Clostridium sp. N3C]|uniref:TIGR02530 family flagellar biosynthesis protein n=1 Tax=Clostridium sp. N3C TaxID=1776758 RepID=UPI00092E0697|nr:TIGR02530 family flagellar biosynthesis protein [Clostridium sp. N3C]SCN21310.1 flagellar operon protein [Clostridium sp. N3C]
MGFRVINGVVYPIGNFPTNNSSNCHKIKDNNSKENFAEILNSKLAKSESFTISKHAADRLRNVNLDSNDMEKINDIINKAEQKGSKNCLILYKDVALVTSIENRTVITAVEEERMKENIFTNIDSVVIM